MVKIDKSSPLARDDSFDSRADLLQRLSDLEQALTEAETEIDHLRGRLASTSMKDSMIGCPNRQQFLDEGAREFGRANRYGSDLCLIVLDLDHFRDANERWGQEAGDQVLVDAAHLCMARCRKSDVFARLSGDEFAILLPSTGEDGATIFAERLLTSISSLVSEWHGQRMAITASLGMAVLSSLDNDFNDFLARSEAAMTGAKEAGRNCLCISRLDDSLV